MYTRNPLAEDLYKVRTKTIVVDFGGDESIYDKLREELTKLEIGTLSKTLAHLGFALS